MTYLKKKVSKNAERITALEKAVCDSRAVKKKQNPAIGINKTILYADNEIEQVELQISLSGRDWYSIQAQQCFQDLMRYLQDLQIPGSTDILLQEED